MGSEFSAERPAEGPLSRREVLKRGAALAAGAAAFPVLSPAIAAAAKRTSTLSAAQIATIKKFMGPVNPKYSGKGQTWKVGGAFGFSSSFSVYGIVMANGVKLAVPQIQQLGGPKIVVDYRDLGYADPTLSRNAYIAFESEKVPFVFDSLEVAGYYANDIVTKNQILAIDPGAGNGGLGQALPYFWGMRADWGFDTWGPGATYMVKTLKKPKAVIVFGSGGGAAVQATYINGDKKAIQAAGGQVVNVVLSGPGTTDYSDTFTQIRSSGDFDYISLGLSGLDEANFLKQYRSSGIGKTVHSWEGLLSPNAKVAGAAGYEGVYCGFIENFSVNSVNPWAQVFVNSYRAMFGDDGLPGCTPSYYSALYYDSAFLLWQLYREVKQHGGNVNSGADLQAALAANPAVRGVIGGTAKAAGTTVFSTKTHGLASQPLGMYRIHNLNPVLVATGYLGSSNIKVVG
jgi:ABC-type branched-subunit amino acid transport system substrate-binding protein